MKVNTQQVDIVYNGLLNDISNCLYMPGEVLVSSQIAKRFNTSRTPVREALFQLKNTGMVEIIPNSGARIRKVSLEELIEMYKIREALEPLAVQELIKSSPGKRVINKLEKMHKRRLNAKTMGESANADKEFHSVILENSGLSVIPEILKTHMILNKTYLQTHQLIPIYKSDGISVVDREHQLIIDAIRNCDIKQAMRVMKKHNQRAVEFLLKTAK